MTNFIDSVDVRCCDMINRHVCVMVRITFHQETPISIIHSCYINRMREINTLHLITTTARLKTNSVHVENSTKVLYHLIAEIENEGR